MIRVVHTGSGSWFFTHPESRIQGSKRHRIPYPDPQHWSNEYKFFPDPQLSVEVGHWVMRIIITFVGGSEDQGGHGEVAGTQERGCADHPQPGEGPKWILEWAFFRSAPFCLDETFQNWPVPSCPRSRPDESVETKGVGTSVVVGGGGGQQTKWSKLCTTLHRCQWWRNEEKDQIFGQCA